MNVVIKVVKLCHTKFWAVAATRRLVLVFSSIVHHVGGATHNKAHVVSGHRQKWVLLHCWRASERLYWFRVGVPVQPVLYRWTSSERLYWFREGVHVQPVLERGIQNQGMWRRQIVIMWLARQFDIVWCYIEVAPQFEDGLQVFRYVTVPVL